jgi:hypothetical protein
MEEGEKGQGNQQHKTTNVCAKIVSPIRCAHAGGFLFIHFSPFPASASASITITGASRL